MNMEKKRIKTTFYTYTGMGFYLGGHGAIYNQRIFHNRILDFVKATVAFNTSGPFESNH